MSHLTAREELTCDDQVTRLDIIAELLTYNVTDTKYHLLTSHIHFNTRTLSIYISLSRLNWSE